jgi:hypothetical protein
MEPELSDCAWCLLPAVDTATFEVNGEELELDLCGQHIEELLSGSRLARCAGFSLPRRRRPAAERAS